MTRRYVQKWVRLAAIGLGLLAGLLGLERPTRAIAAGTLWLGNDTVGHVFQTDTTGAVLRTILNTPTTGIAFDGTNLYFSNFDGNATKRTADGGTILDSFLIPKSPFVCCAEDLAWDTTRDRLWRLDHSAPPGVPSFLRKINPVTEMEEAAFPMPLQLPMFSNLGGIGVAYDSMRDLLYVSFCHAGCSAPLTDGIVLTVDPDTGTVLGTLFQTDRFGTLGLAFDRTTDTLWVGDFAVVRNVTLAGVELSNFARPPGGGAVDGLEFIPVPAPGTLVLLSAALALLGGLAWRRPD